MSEVMVASDAPWVHDEITAVLGGANLHLHHVTSGPDAIDLAYDEDLDLAILDLQIANMGAMAICLELHLEESGGRLDHIPVLMLLDRRPDVFLARRSDAEGWLVKPIDPLRLRQAVRTLLAGGTYEDDSYRPPTVPATVGTAGS